MNIFLLEIFQVPPVCEEIKALYNGYCLQCNSLTVAIILVNNHKFFIDPEYGLMSERIVKGEAT